MRKDNCNLGEFRRLCGNLVQGKVFSTDVDDFLEVNGAGELSVFCQSCFKSMLIGQAGSIGGKTRQEIEVMQ